MNHMKKIVVLLLASMLSLPALAAPLPAAPLLIAAAADLSYCIDDIAAAFRKDVPDTEIKISIGSSGNLFAQIRNGAPFDAFLSADVDYPSRLARLGAAEGRTLTRYAVGRIAMWSLDPKLDVDKGLALLRDPRITRVAIANPATAPYGRAAKSALERDGLWEAVQSKLVIGENISQTAQFVQTGNAQVGLVSLASLRSPRLAGVGRYALVPDTGLAPIEQAAIVTKHGADNPLAARFVRFLGSPAARAILERNGFSIPAHSAPEPAPQSPR
jgi:molybdate transport system substrate-binding protein